TPSASDSRTVVCFFICDHSSLPVSTVCHNLITLSMVQRAVNQRCPVRCRIGCDDSSSLVRRGGFQLARGESWATRLTSVLSDFFMSWRRARQGGLPNNLPHHGLPSSRANLGTDGTGIGLSIASIRYVRFQHSMEETIIARCPCRSKQRKAILTTPRCSAPGHTSITQIIIKLPICFTS